MSEKVVIVIPARRHSTRLPEKLLLSETGKPLLAHTIERVLEARSAASGLIQRVLVAVDDPALVDAARAAGAEAVMTSPACASGSDRVAEAVRDLDCDIVVNVQGDEPEIDPNTVICAARLLMDSDAPMGTLAAPLHDPEHITDPAVVKVVLNRRGHALYFSRAAIPYDRDAGGARRVLRHVGIYAYRRAFLLAYRDLPPSTLEATERLEQLRALEAGYAIQVARVEHVCAGIDTRKEYDRFVARHQARLAAR
jgi:3-deoxy-manno-octulosonate cytidylyltransferase (CMP-KDO synthetase)